MYWKHHNISPVTDSIFTAQAKVKPKVNFVHLPIV